MEQKVAGVLPQETRPALQLVPYKCQRCSGTGECWPCWGTGWTGSFPCSFCAGSGQCYFCTGTGESARLPDPEGP